MTPRVRLAVLVVAITVIPLLLAVLHVGSAHELRDQVHQAGPWAPLLWVVLSSALGAALFPGPVLAGASGLLFGTTTGTLVTVVSAVLSAMISREIGQRAGHSGAVEILGRRAAAVERISATEGLPVVLVQRLAPGIPDAPLSYAFGAAGFSRRDVALGTALGTLPRAFAYTAIGASLDHPTSALSYVALSVVVLTAIGGAVLGRRAWTRMRS